MILSTPFDVGSELDAYRAAPPPAFAGTLSQFGLPTSGRMLEIGAVALASQPFAATGWTTASIHPANAAATGLGAASFDAALAHDVLHVLDATAVLAELRRIVRPGGVVAISWRTLPADNDVHAVRAEAARQARLDPVEQPLAHGFRAFYGAGFVETTIRVLPARVRTTVADWARYERTRPEIAAAYGSNAGRWHDALHAVLTATYGAETAAFDVVVHTYAYLAKV